MSGKGPFGRYFTGIIQMDGDNVTARLYDGSGVLLTSFPRGYSPVDGEKVTCHVHGCLKGGLYGRVVRTAERTYMDLTGSRLPCQVIDFKPSGDPVVRPVGRRGKLRGILEIYPPGLQQGERVTVEIHGHNGRDDCAPTAFFGTVMPRNPSETLDVSVRVLDKIQV